MRILRSSFAVTFLLVVACATTSPQRPTTTPPAPPAPLSNRMTPVSTSPRALAPPLIRVGLLTDQDRVSFDRIENGYVIVTPAGPSILKRGFTVSAPLSGAAVRYALQAATMTDQSSADASVARLSKGDYGRVDSVFSPITGYRILVGDFEDSKSAEPLRARLLAEGYDRDIVIVRRPSDQQFKAVHTLVDDEGDSYSMEAESILVLPVTRETVTIDKQPWRGGARVHINNRGLFNVANELNLEEYMRGVVPAEMGPSIYDEIEALKAQALAARTYAIRNLGQFAAEGYDICPTPACQAYRGFAAEHALSDQAVRETAGMIITYQGEPIDALYSATCGGETSDVGTMFPGRNEPYLKRARCVELDLVSLQGRADGNRILSEMQIDAAIFESLMATPAGRESWSAREASQAVAEANRLAGLQPAASAALSSVRRRDVLEYLGRIWKLADAAEVLLLPEDRKYFFTRSPQDAFPYLAASFLIKFRIIPIQHIDKIDLNTAMPREELYSLLYWWLREQDALREANGKIHQISGRQVTLKAEGKRTSFTLPDGIPIFRKINERGQEYAAVPILIGDRATILQDRAGRPLAMIVVANYDGTSFDRTSNFANWTRSYRANELVESIAKRNPIKELQDLRPLVVDESHRIAEMEVIAEGGRTFVLKGLPVRWSLAVPDNLFVMQKTKDPDGVDRWTFFGKGWGHGTGMCQVGAYGMGFRGYTAEQILKRYYTGIEIVNAGTVKRQ